jgi:ubiquitin-conjugating enzyme E2 J2|tara:strand:- start:633 stop:1259 length:627 start_codon:yes stop_codon:yes gene_type:complete
MAVQRLQKELRLLSKDPLPFITARPDTKNILVWHYVLVGDEASEFKGGQYHGKVTFPSQYPFRPPSIVMVTPSGRFQSNTRLCLSMSDYHPETWNPSWSVTSILAGLQSFFYETTQTTGSVNSCKSERAKLALTSKAFNARNPTFRKVFPELVEVSMGGGSQEAARGTAGVGGAYPNDALARRNGERVVFLASLAVVVCAVLVTKFVS